jgi:uncharacterized protein (DUF433 family)
MPTQFTPTEAAALLELSERSIRKEFEHGIFPRRARPRLGLPGLVYLRTLPLLGLNLGVKDRKKVLVAIRKAMKASPSPEAVKLSEVMTIQVGQVVKDLTARTERFVQWKDKLVEDSDILGGEPVFPGSRLSVRHIGQIAERGESTEDILEDYPYLTASDVSFARIFARAYPCVGRPRASRQAPTR